MIFLIFFPPGFQTFDEGCRLGWSSLRRRGQKLFQKVFSFVRSAADPLRRVQFQQQGFIMFDIFGETLKSWKYLGELLISLNLQDSLPHSVWRNILIQQVKVTLAFRLLSKLNRYYKRKTLFIKYKFIIFINFLICDTRL